MIKLSYVLPCYNVDRYITDCLNSIYAQDMPEDEYEVICVNDCSTDGTRVVIDNFANEHSNLVLIDHEQNLSVGGARNTGVEAAKGEYVWFVDPDDLVKPHAVKELLNVATVEDLDVLMFNFDIVFENLKLKETNRVFADSEVLTGQDYVKHYFSNRFSEFCIVWRCIFKRAFIKDNKLWFPKMPKAEDVTFLWTVMLVAQRVASVSNAYYTYRCNPYSVANKKLDAHVMFSERMLRGFEIEKMLTDCRLSIQEPLENDMRNALCWCVNSNLALLEKMSENERGRYYDEIKHYRDVLKHVWPYMKRKQKLLFYTWGGKMLWLLKVKLLVMLGSRRR